jgi:hypothetical protein
MIYSDFILKTTKYLKSVRVLKNYITFDMVFPQTWVFYKKYPSGIEVIINDDAQSTVHSFVCENRKELIDSIEILIENLIKNNIEREEKERLFKSKVQELKSIFDKEKLENLKSLKFDIEELTKLIEDESEEANTGVEETA